MPELELTPVGLSPESWWLNFAWLRDRITKLEHEVFELRQQLKERSHGDSPPAA